jgi:hypothetical protein
MSNIILVSFSVIGKVVNYVTFAEQFIFSVEAHRVAKC